MAEAQIDTDLNLPPEVKDIKLEALSPTSREQIAQRLNLQGMITSTQDENGHVLDIMSDYKGLGELIGFDYVEIKNFELHSNPTHALLDLWTFGVKYKTTATIGNLWNFLKLMGRDDVLKDCRRSILYGCKRFNRSASIKPTAVKPVQKSTVKNCTRFGESACGAHLVQDSTVKNCTRFGKSACGAHLVQDSTVNNCTGFGETACRTHSVQDSSVNGCQHFNESARIQADTLQDPTVSSDEEMEIDDYTDLVAVVDVDNALAGISDRVQFEAFVCLSIEDPLDRDFVRYLIHEISDRRGLKLFVPWRDDIAGGVQNRITAFFIQKRCKHVVILLSKAFLESPALDFLLRLAILSSGVLKERLILVVREPDIPIPYLLKGFHIHDFSVPDKVDLLWNRLADAIRAPVGPMTTDFSVELEQKLKELRFPTQPYDTESASGSPRQTEPSNSELTGPPQNENYINAVESSSSQEETEMSIEENL